MIEYSDTDVSWLAGPNPRFPRWALVGLRPCAPVHPQRRSQDGIPPMGQGPRRFCARRGRWRDGAGRYGHAKARGAKIYAELSGFGMSADAGA